MRMQASEPNNGSPRAVVPPLTPAGGWPCASTFACAALARSTHSGKEQKTKQ